MLNEIRKTADSFVMRVLLAMIAFAFVGWGIKDVLQNTNNSDIVTFADAKNISEEDFLKEKSEQISFIQKQTGKNLTEEEVKQLNIDNYVIRKLINNRIMNYLVHYYDLDLTDNSVIQLVRESADFKNKQGVFDITIFKDFFKNAYFNEEQYLSNVKEHILKNTLISIFLESFKTPKIMIKNIVDYMAETREVELVQINLKENPANLITPNPTIEQLGELYKQQQDLFKIPEKRSFSYVKILNENLRKLFSNSKEELLNFYHENKEEFADKKFEQVQKQIDELLIQQKTEQQTTLLTKDLEDHVAAGSSLAEIAEKYGLAIQHVESASYQELLDSKTDISLNIDNIFELVEGELSYPMELTNKEGIVIIEIKSITPSKLREFSMVKDQLKTLWINQYLNDLNLKTIEILAKEYTSVKRKDLLPEITSQSVSFSRSEIQHNEEFPAEFLSMIFQTKIGSSTAVFQSKGKAYFAHVKSIIIDPVKSQEMQKKNNDDIANAVKNNVMDELINYAIKKNNTKFLRKSVNISN